MLIKNKKKDRKAKDLIELKSAIKFNLFFLKFDSEVISFILLFIAY